MLSAFTLKFHIKSPSKIQTRSQTCKQFTQKRRATENITEYRYTKNMRVGGHAVTIIEYRYTGDGGGKQ